MRINLVITKFSPINTPSILLRTYLLNVLPRQVPVQNIPLVSVIVAPERQAAARNRRRENLKSGSFSCPSTRQRKEMEVANAKKSLPPKDQLFMFMITSRLWKNFQFFKKSTNRSIILTTPLNARICTLEQTELRGFALCGLVEL